MCCSTQCCQTAITSIQEEIEAWDDEYKIPPGGFWKDRKRHKSTNPELAKSYQRLRAIRDKHIRAHVECLQRLALGWGITNERRALSGDNPLPIHRIQIPEIPYDFRIGIDAPKSIYAKRQAAYEISPTGQHDRARYEAFISGHKDDSNCIQAAVARFAGSPEFRQLQDVAQYGGTLPAQGGLPNSPSLHQQPETLSKAPVQSTYHTLPEPSPSFPGQSTMESLTSIHDALPGPKRRKEGPECADGAEESLDVLFNLEKLIRDLLEEVDSFEDPSSDHIPAHDSNGLRTHAIKSFVDRKLFLHQAATRSQELLLTLGEQRPIPQQISKDRLEVSWEKMNAIQEVIRGLQALQWQAYLDLPTDWHNEINAQVHSRHQSQLHHGSQSRSRQGRSRHRSGSHAIAGSTQSSFSQQG